MMDKADLIGWIVITFLLVLGALGVTMIVVGTLGMLGAL